MTKPVLPLPKALPMPLRDILRGVASFAEATEDFLEPAAQALPGPVREAFRSALETLEGTGTALMSPQVDHAAIHRAAAFLRGEAAGPEDAEYCAAVLGYAWAHLRGETPDFHLMLSETLTSLSLSQVPQSSGQSPSAHAAAVVMALRKGHVAGTLPGLPVEISESEAQSVDLKLVAFSIWLLAVRGDRFEEEAQLLEMAMALTRAFEPTVLEAMDRQEALAEQLRSLSDHL